MELWKLSICLLCSSSSVTCFRLPKNCVEEGHRPGDQVLTTDLLSLIRTLQLFTRRKIHLLCLMGCIICCISSFSSSTDFYLLFRYGKKHSSSKMSLCIVNSTNTLHKMAIILFLCARYNHASVHRTPSNTTIRKTFLPFC